MPDNEIKDDTKGKTGEPNIIFLGFADNKVPEFKEVNSKDYIYFGEKNDFPDFLLYLFNKSSNHNAIINGKVTYIIGKGLMDNVPVNRSGDKINTILKRSCTDIELFGGFYWQVIWDRAGRISDIIHMPFQNIRKGKDNSEYFHAKKWKNVKRDDVKPIPAFDLTKRVGVQLFAYREYRPGCEAYPLPGYFGALNDIETDVEISIYNLSVIKNGQFAGKLVSFFDGVPTEEQKKKLEKKWNDKFQGSGNAGKTMLSFNRADSKPPQVDDLSATDLDKLFDQLNKTTQAEIFSGHQITSPTLFGIMEPGKLGGRSEMQDAYEIFKNTYVNEKQMALEEVIELFAPLVGIAPGSKLQPVEPIGTTLDPVNFKEMLPKEWIYEKLGIDPEEYPDTSGVSGQTSINSAGQVNEHLKNLTGRQLQGLERIMRKYKKGQIGRPMAETMLKSSLGLTDSEIATFLTFGEIDQETSVADMFNEVGQSKELFTIVKSKPTRFKTDALEFKDLGNTDAAILDLIKKDKRITSRVIADTLNMKPAVIEARIKALEESKVLTKTTQTIGVDTIIEHAVNPESIDRVPPPETVDVTIRYSYEPKPGLDPVIPTTRPFCKRLIELDKFYSRAEIESISQRVGYSVWDRKGGFWGHKDECRHRWVSHIVVKKKTA